MYYHTRINYQRKKEADGSVTVTRLPVYDGVEVVWALPAFIILFGIAATMYNVVTLNWDCIGGLWSGIWVAEIITLVLACIVTVVSFVLEPFKK